jgi:hypothetical protein
MSRVQCEANLDDICRRLEDYAVANLGGFSSARSVRATRLSESLFLAHSTADAKFSAICASRYLAPALNPGRAEVVLGTAGSVFFFVSPFRYPNTGCGLLFARTVELLHAEDGVASPFDSGGLLDVFTRPDMTESPREFLSRHELPVPQHRGYLARCMDTLFQRPEDYADGSGPRLQGPIGLSGGDQRCWTHEVRIPDRVFLHSGHLQAVFAPRARVAADRQIEGLFQWCATEGVDRIPFDIPSSRNGFEALQNECLAYIRRKLY